MPCIPMEPVDAPKAIAVTLLLRRLMPLQLTLVELADIIGKQASSSKLQAPTRNFRLWRFKYANLAGFVSGTAPGQKLLDRHSVLRQGEAPLQLDTVRARTLGGDYKQIRMCTWCLGGSAAVVHFCRD